MSLCVCLCVCVCVCLVIWTNDAVLLLDLLPQGRTASLWAARRNRIGMYHLGGCYCTGQVRLQHTTMLHYSALLSPIREHITYRTLPCQSLAIKLYDSYSLSIFPAGRAIIVTHLSQGQRSKSLIFGKLYINETRMSRFSCTWSKYRAHRLRWSENIRELLSRLRRHDEMTCCEVCNNVTVIEPEGLL